MEQVAFCLAVWRYAGDEVHATLSVVTERNGADEFADEVNQALQCVRARTEQQARAHAHQVLQRFGFGQPIITGRYADPRGRPPPVQFSLETDFDGMCGRYTHLLTWEELRNLMSLTTDLTVPLNPRFNISPTQTVPVVRLNERGEREVVALRWGLIPSWSKDEKSGYSMINARAETLTTKPSFRDAFKKRRCLIPASGFYEWEKLDSKTKQPWHIQLKGREPFAMAGIWERWASKQTGELIESVAIITCESNELVRPLHERMPVILHRKSYEAWLSPNAKLEALQAMLVPITADAMERYTVGRDVNSARSDEARFVERM